jgi:hypothetical protein
MKYTTRELQTASGWIRALNDPDYWKETPPHEKYGNIYYPHHIHDEGMLRYGIKNVETGQMTHHHLSWVDATSICRSLNEQ